MRIPTKPFAITVVLLLSFLLTPITLAAQTGTNEWSRLSGVANASKLSVGLKDGKKVEGTLIVVSDTSLSLTVKNVRKEIPRDDIASVYVVTKKSATKATLIGLGVGAGVGTALVLANEKSENDTFFETPNSISAGVAVVTAGIGALTGFLIGRSRKKRVLLYESK